LKAYWEVFIERFCDAFYMTLTYNLLLNLEESFIMLYEKDSKEDIIKMMQEDVSLVK